MLGEEFTFARARSVVRAVADWVGATRPGAGVVVAHDTRFLGERLCEEAERVLLAVHVPTWRGRGAVPTPAVARGVVRRRAAAGLVFTASHNPSAYQGLKLLTGDGASAPPSLTREIELRANRLLAGGEVAREAEPGRPVDLLAPYRRSLLRRLDRDALARARPRVLYDALHGTGAGVLDAVLRRAGARVETFRTTPDAEFGGASPDPVPARLRDLCRTLRRGRGLRLGLATDGDGDRFAAVDAGGRVLSETEAAALLVDHLARTGRLHRGVALTWATGSLVERVAREHGLAVERTPIGFKHLSRRLLEDRAELAADESGGLAWKAFGVDKDGILAGALLAELVAQTRRPLGDRLAALVRSFGPCACGRVALEATPARAHALARRLEQPPDRLAGARVLAVAVDDGLRLGLRDGFVWLRASGTEPVLRIYAEAPRSNALRARLRAGARLLERG